jgi:hypothetical protein
MPADTAASGSFGRGRLLMFGVIVASLVIPHIPYLSLPYFWDELGQFIPASLDILRDNAWVPHSTVPNVHPPGVMAYLALVWSAFGYSVIVTRLAMLMLAALGVYATFLLAVHLCPRAPAFVAAGLLIITPLFYMQAMMAQLDMPAMTFTVLALLLFLRRKYAWCVAACTALVLAKETGAVAPALFAAWLVLRERKWKEAAWFAVPFAALAVWLFVLWRATGNVLGDPGFAHYNVGYPLEPIRLVATFLRRLYFLFLADFRWIGTVAVLYAIRGTACFHSREWSILAWFSGAHILLISAFGGAALERYLLPAFPLLYIAMASAWQQIPVRWRSVSQVAVFAGLLAGLFWNPPFPFPLENNLAMVDFVKLQKAAADYLDRSWPGSVVASAWPYTGALRRSDLGFTRIGYRVVETNDFHPANVLNACRAHSPDLLVLYSRTWEPSWGVIGNRLVKQFLHKYYDYQPQITAVEVESQLGMRPVAGWERRGQWIEVFRR